MPHAKTQTLSLSDDLEQSAWFGFETLTIRMLRPHDDKYVAGKLQPGPLLLVTPGGREVPVELTRVPEAKPDHPRGSMRIRDLTADDLIANGILHAPDFLMTEEELRTPFGLRTAQEYILHNLAGFYDPKKYEYDGLDTEIFVFGWEPPAIAHHLQTIWDGFERSAAAIFENTIEGYNVRYYPEYSNENAITVAFTVRTTPEYYAYSDYFANRDVLAERFTALFPQDGSIAVEASEGSGSDNTIDFIVTGSPRVIECAMRTAAQKVATGLDPAVMGAFETRAAANSYAGQGTSRLADCP